MIKENIWKRIIDYSKTIAKGVLIYYYIKTYICEVSLLEGPSMEPTLNEESVVLIDKLSLLYRKIRRNEVVSLKSPLDSSVLLCKRVIGIEDDHIKLNRHKTIVIPYDYIWVEGDNKHNSADSRLFGPIKSQMVIGRVILQLYPKFKWLNKQLSHHKGNRVSYYK